MPTANVRCFPENSQTRMFRKVQSGWRSPPRAMRKSECHTESWVPCFRGPARSRLRRNLPGRESMIAPTPRATSFRRIFSPPTMRQYRHHDARRPRRAERLRRLATGTSRGQHVIHEQDRQPAQARAGPRSESIVDVLHPSGRSLPHLEWRRANPPQPTGPARKMQMIRQSAGQGLALIVAALPPAPPMQGHRDHRIRSHRAEARPHSLGPQVANLLGRQLPLALFDAQDHLAEQTLIRTEPESLLEVKPPLPAADAARLGRYVRPDGAGAARAGRVWIGAQCRAAGLAKSGFLRRERPAASSAHAGIEQLQDAPAQFPPQHCATTEHGEKHKKAKRDRLISLCLCTGLSNSVKRPASTPAGRKPVPERRPAPRRVRPALPGPRNRNAPGHTDPGGRHGWRYR